MLLTHAEVTSRDLTSIESHILSCTELGSTNKIKGVSGDLSEPGKQKGFQAHTEEEMQESSPQLPTS